MMTLVIAGCDSPAPTGPPDLDAGPTPCMPGELTLDDGTCQPAGLPPDMPCPPGELLLKDGITCQKAGLPPDMPCPPGELLLDNGTCQKAGVPPSACGVGFMPDGKEGCEPILPADPCPEGLMAIPGDTACHEVASCGSGAWGDIPVEANTQFVDKSYAGGNSDGTQAKPWTTIQKGVNAAAKGAIVAVAAGSYPEDVVIQGKAVRLWGRCPAMVEVVGTGVQLGAIQVLQNAANGAEVHSISATGAKVGIAVSGASDVVIEAVWIHGTGLFGLDIENAYGPTKVTLKGSLIEQSHEVGVFVLGSDATIEATLVRSTQPNAQGDFGRGMSIQRDPNTKRRATATLHACLIEENHYAGVVVSSSDATIEATVIRSTLPNASGGGFGIDIAQGQGTGTRANVTVRACLVEQNHAVGVFVEGSDATIESTVVRSTLPNLQGELGRGIAVQNDHQTKDRAHVTIHASLIEQSHDVGVYIGGSDAIIEATVVRSTLPDALGGGHGITIEIEPDTEARANVVVRACLVEQSLEAGVLVVGADAIIEATVVRFTAPNAQGDIGNGIAIQDDLATKARAGVTVRACVVEQNQGLGVSVLGSDAIIETTLVRSTLPNGQGETGRGIEIGNDIETGARGNAVVRACLVEQNHDVGIYVGGSDATLEATVIRSTLPAAKGGRGISIEATMETKARAKVAIHACVVEQNHDIGVHIMGSDVTIESTVVHSTQLDVEGKGGRGIDINVQDHDGAKERANVTIHACVIEQNHEIGVFVGGSDATIESTVVRSTQPDALGDFGRGINIQDDPVTKERANVTVRACVIEQHHEDGVFVEGSDATIETTVIRSDLPDAQGDFGRGIDIQRNPVTTERADVTVRACLIERNHDVGVYISRSSATIVDSTVRDTAPDSDGTFGDGISLVEGTATIQDVEITHNARAGVSSFGGQVVITGGVITCNGFDLEGEPMNNTPFSFDGSTGWRCSEKAPAECTELGDCHVETIGIKAPSELPPVDPLPPADPTKP
jgi:hypothetical protein